jgi:small subunit ribosomal protein S16
LAVKIRLMRVGKTKQPSYRVVVADSRSPRDGRIIERIGKYAPLRNPSLVEIDGDRALDWLRKGAQPTEQAQKLLAATGVWARYESEKGGPVRTKLARRGVTPGGSPPPPKTKKQPKAPGEQSAAATPQPEAAPAGEPAAEPVREATAEAAAAEASVPVAAEPASEEGPAEETSEEPEGGDGEGAG